MIAHLRKKFDNQSLEIGVIGLGYVGLPLATLLATKYRVRGFDIDKIRVGELGQGVDRTGEVRSKSALQARTLSFHSEPTCLRNCDVIIIAVPTPVDEYKTPDLTPMISAAKTAGLQLSSNKPVIVFESTVYPGVTEEVCLPAIESASGKKFGTDFYLGYSPERVNPGDHVNTIDKIKKVVSGSSPEVASFLGDLYGSVITAGVHIAPSIKVAEAAKVIENTQRDVNIALVNELAILFERIGVDTQDVLAAARTKWNFLDFRPGLVGGHCIGVDPYYLTHLAARVGHHCQLINAGRQINDDMARCIAEKTVSMLVQSPKRVDPTGPLKVMICGVTFKENVPDTRNTKVVDVAAALRRFGIQVFAHDPVADAEHFYQEYGWKLSNLTGIPAVDGVVLAVKHREFGGKENQSALLAKLGGSKVIVDIKSQLNGADLVSSGYRYWRL